MQTLKTVSVFEKAPGIAEWGPINAMAETGTETDEDAEPI